MRPVSTLFCLKLPKIQICPIYETNKTKDLFKTKSKDAVSVRSNVVYNYTCDTCKKVYIGATERHFRTRQNEHIGKEQI